MRTIRGLIEAIQTVRRTRSAQYSAEYMQGAMDDIVVDLQRFEKEFSALRTALNPFAICNPHNPPDGVNAKQWLDDVNRAHALMLATAEQS